MEIVAKTGRDVYVHAVQHAMNGVKRSPRGRPTRDAGFTTILLETPYDALPLHCGRSPRPAIAAVEALQLIGAVTIPNLMFCIAPKFREFTESDGRFHGAYGARVKSQVVDAVTKLRVDPNTRQAVVTLWDPILDNLRGKHDYPCTVALQFQVDDGQLCMNTFMRSNDVWLGLAYDMFQFTQLQLSVARTLDLQPGWYRHTTLSLHVYDDDLDNAQNVHSPTFSGDSVAFQPMGIGKDSEPFTIIQRRARDILRGLLTTTTTPTTSELWFVNQLQPYLAERHATDVG